MGFGLNQCPPRFALRQAQGKLRRDSFLLLPPLKNICIFILTFVGIDTGGFENPPAPACGTLCAIFTTDKMIESAEIINQPYSGEYDERLYDNESPWNSQDWTWIKFINDDQTEWCGQFRGFPREVKISKINKIALVLTSDYLFQLDLSSANVMAIEDRPTYLQLTTTPQGDFLIADYYNIEKLTNDINNKTDIESPVQMDMIKFLNWKENKLEFTCDEFSNWDRHLLMEYDSLSNKIEIKI